MGPSREDDVLAALEPVEFGDSAAMHDQLAGLVVNGSKTATASLLVEYDLAGEALPIVGQRWLLSDSGGRRLAVLETTEVQVVPMGKVDLRFALAEGEGFRSVAEWRVAHEVLWNRELERLRAAAGDLRWRLSDDTPVVCERFRVVRRIAQGDD